MLLIIRRAARPRVAVLGNIPGTRGYSDIERNAQNVRVPGAIIFRCEASILYFNAQHVRDTVLEKVQDSAEPVRLVVCDLSASPVVDLAGARMLTSLYERLSAHGIRLRVVGAHAAVRDMLRAEGLDDRVGHIGRSVSLADVIDEFTRSATGLRASQSA
jgi:anti-anti-sigma factor